MRQGLAASAHGGGSLVEHAIAGIREHIRVNDLKVGDRLPGEGAFANEFGVSKAVMREAFGALAALRLIDVGNGRRARVGAIDGSVMGTSLDHAVSTSQLPIADVWEVRRTLELRIAELAAGNRTAEEAAEIVAAAEAMMMDRADLAAVTRHDIRFHQAVARASRNGLYLQIVRAYEPLMRIAVPSAWRTRTTEAQRADMLELHLRIARKIRDGNVRGAREAMDDHFDASIGEALGS